LRSIANTANIITNTNNAGQLQQPDSTETGADQGVLETGGTPLGDGGFAPTPRIVFALLSALALAAASTADRRRALEIDQL
jgi:hypothetical protein